MKTFFGRKVGEQQKKNEKQTVSLKVGIGVGYLVTHNVIGFRLAVKTNSIFTLLMA